VTAPIGGQIRWNNFRASAAAEFRRLICTFPLERSQTPGRLRLRRPSAGYFRCEMVQRDRPRSVKAIASTDMPMLRPIGTPLQRSLAPPTSWSRIDDDALIAASAPLSMTIFRRRSMASPSGLLNCPLLWPLTRAAQKIHSGYDRLSAGTALRTARVDGAETIGT
jgi:hypothetical protein